MRAVAGLLLGLVLGLAVGWFTGRHYGALGAAAQCDARTLAGVQRALDSHKALVAEAAAATRAMRDALARRAQQDDQSTREIRDALAKTADRRRDCDVPADVMRQLADARDRAAAAAAGGVRGALPDAADGTGPPAP